LAGISGREHRSTGQAPSWQKSPLKPLTSYHSGLRSWWAGEFAWSRRLVLPVAPNVPPPCLDVNDDGSVGPLDVLAVINYINARLGAGASEERPS